MQGETINERVKILRKKLNMNQIEFATSIGITQGTLSGIENGNVKVTNGNIISICKVHNVSKIWLEDGIGKIEADIKGELVDVLVDILKDETPFVQNMFIEIAKMPKEERETLKKAFEIIKKITSI